MGNFEDALARLSRLELQAEARKGASAPDPLAPATLQGATFRAGDAVRDLVTGEEGHVVDTRFVLASFPAPGRPNG